MRTRNHIASILALIAFLVLGYIGSWFLFSAWTTKTASNDPFGGPPEGIAAKMGRVAFKPINHLAWTIERREVIDSGRLSMQGTWEGPIPGRSRQANLKVKIEGEEVTFLNAPSWPEIEGKSYAIVEDRKNWVIYFVTDLGTIFIQTPSELIDDGGSPDVMYLRTDDFLPSPEEDFKMTRATK